MVYTLVQLQWAVQQYQCLVIHVGAIVLRDEKEETPNRSLNSKCSLETGENLKLTPMNIGVKIGLPANMSRNFFNILEGFQNVEESLNGPKGQYVEE